MSLGGSVMLFLSSNPWMLPSSHPSYPLSYMSFDYEFFFANLIFSLGISFFVNVIIARLMGVQSTALGFHRHTRRHHPGSSKDGGATRQSLWSYSIHSRLRMSTCSKCPTSRYVMISMFSSCTEWFGIAVTSRCQDHSSLSSVFTALTPFYALNSCNGWTSSTYRHHPLWRQYSYVIPQCSPW